MAHNWRTFLREEMVRQNLNAKELSKAVNKGETYIRDITEGRPSKGGGPAKPPSEPGAFTFAEIARVLGMSVQKLMRGEDATHPKITVIGSISDDERWAPVGKKDPKQPARFDFKIEGGEPVALEVRGNGLMASGYRNGDLLIGAKHIGEHADNLLGLECIVMTERGERYVMYLERGNVRGTFNLVPHLAADRAKAKVNVKISWAAPIMWIKRA
jgi:hypothetical protein